jgi:hypothetical protein
MEDIRPEDIIADLAVADRQVRELDEALRQQIGR